MSNSYVNKIQVGSDTHLIQPTLYKNSAGTASAITAAVSGFVLIEGATVYVKITTTNNANATLNINSTGAKAIQYNGTAITANVLKANHIYNFVYDGTNWQLIGDLDTNTQSNYGNITTSGKIGTTADLAVYTTTDGLVTAGTLKTDAPSASGTATAFITSVSQDSKGKISASKANLPTASTDTAGITKVGASGGAAAYDHNHDTLYIKSSDELLTTNPFAPASLKGPYISKIDNAFYAADQRWTVSGTNISSISNLFDGSYETNGNIAAGKTSIITIDFDPNHNNSAYFPGYPYGYILISFYYTFGPASVSGRVYCNYSSHGVGWHNISFSPMNDNTSQAIVYRSEHQGYYNISQLEITITAGSTNAQPTQIEMHLDRPNSSLTPFLSKYKPEKLYYSLTAPQFIGALEGTVNISTSNGFTYSGIGIGESAGNRPIWYSYLGVIGRPVYSTNFQYNPATTTITIGTGTLSATNYSGTAAIATKSTVTAHTNTTNGNKNYYPWFSTATSGNLGARAHAGIYIYETVTSGAISSLDFCMGSSTIIGSITLWDGTNHWGNIKSENLSANRKYTLPDQAGTFALLTKTDTNTLINLLDTGSSPLTANDYVITQYVGGGTTTTTYHRRPASKVVNETLVKAALGTVGTTAKKFLKDTGDWTQVDWGDLTNIPTTLSGYGITDAASSSHSHTLKIGNKSLSVSTSEQTWSVDDILTSTTSIGITTSWDITNSGMYRVAAGDEFTGEQNPGTNDQNMPYTYGALYVMRGGDGGAAQFYINHNASNASYTTRAGIRYRSGWNVVNHTRENGTLPWQPWATILDDKNYSLYAWKRPASITANQVLVSSGTVGETALRGIRNNTSAGELGWTSQATDKTLVTTNTIAYWNGAYAGTNSNLTILGAVTTGTWKASVIGAAYIDSAIARLASPEFTGTPTAPTAADGTNSTQIATTAFVMSQFKYNDAMIYKGVVNANSDLPTTHYQGWTYKVATAGTYAGIVCEIGDMIICNTDGTSANNAHWNVIQTNIDGAVIGPSSSTTNSLAVFSNTTGKVIKDTGTYVKYLNHTPITVGDNTFYQDGLIISGTGKGSANDLQSGLNGVLSWGDAGPQIQFISAGQKGSIIFTEYDVAGLSTSWHFVTDQANGANVTSTGFTAKKYMTVGQNNITTSYNLYVNGTSYFSNTILAHSDLKFDRTNQGVYLKDGAGVQYAGIYDNGSNLWIGASSSVTNHHKGNVYISTGYGSDGVTGNKYGFISIPTNTDGTITHTPRIIATMELNGAAGNSNKPAYIDSYGYLTTGLPVFVQNPTVINSSTDWNTLMTPGCYTVNMSAWGDAATYHSPNETQSNLYSFGLLFVIRGNENDAEKRTLQIYFPHQATKENPIYCRMANGSGPSWQAWHRLTRGTFDTSVLTSGILTTTRGGTGVNSHTSNRLVWSTSATTIQGGYHYANATKVAINSTSEPSYNFYVNGTSYLNGATTINNALTLTSQTSAFNDKNILFSSGGRIGGNTNGEIGIYSAGKIYIKPSSSAASSTTKGIILDDTGLYPVSTGSDYYLGTSTNKWNLLYTTLINQAITGTGTVGSYTNSTYYPAKWTFNTGKTAQEGDMVTIKLPCAGHDYGVFMSIDNGANYYPVVTSGTNRVTSHFPNGSYITVIFNSSGSAASMFALVGQTSSTRITVTGGVWQVLNYYDSGNDRGYMFNTQKAYKVSSTAITAYDLIAEDINGYLVPAHKVAHRVGSPIYLKEAALNANATGSWATLWSAHHHITIRKDGNNLSLTTYAPVFLKGTISAGIFTPDTATPFISTKANCNVSGAYYMYIGDATGATTISFNNNHPYYYYNGTNLLLYTEQSGNADTATSLTNFVVTTRTINPSSGVRIHYPLNSLVLISCQQTLGGGRLILIGGGYGANDSGNIRNNFTELVSSNTAVFSWSIPESASYSCCIEIMNNISSEQNVTLQIWAKAACTFDEITALTTAATNHTLLTTNNYDDYALPLSGGTMTTSSLITIGTGNTHRGIKAGDTYINSVGGDLIFQNNRAIRFGSDAWDYNQWAGLKYDHSVKTVYLGLADKNYLTANTAQTNGTTHLVNMRYLYMNTKQILDTNLAIDNTAFKNTLLLFSNQSNESAVTEFDATKSSWGIGFQRQWNSGTLGQIAAGIYAYGITNWRTGLVFRTKTGTSSANSHDTNALILNHNGNATFVGNVTASGFTGDLDGHAATATSANYINLYEARGTTTTLNKVANYVAAGAMFHLVASSSTSPNENGKTPTDANILQMNWDNSGGYDSQLGIYTGGNRMYFRSRVSEKTAWDEVAHAPVSSNNTGSARQPVYMTSTGVITAGNNTVAHFGNNPGKTNMNDIGRLYASTGMIKLTSTDNADTPKNGDTYTTDWHLYWDTCYQDDPSGSNAWVAQIVNKAGTNNWWVRSRSGSTITDGTAWASTWRHLVTSTEAAVGNSTTPVYVDANGAVQSCTAYSSASVNYATSAGSATTASNVTQSSSTADLARPIWFCYQENNSYILGRAGYNTNFMYNPGTKTITIGSGSLSETEYSGNAATATSASKVSATLNQTTKTYLLGTTTTITATAAKISLTGDTGVYLTTTAGELSAVRHSWNVSGTEKAYTTYNSTDDSIDFVFI